jgi:hypothetical protein
MLWRGQSRRSQITLQHSFCAGLRTAGHPDQRRTPKIQPSDPVVTGLRGRILQSFVDSLRILLPVLARAQRDRHAKDHQASGQAPLARPSSESVRYAAGQTVTSYRFSAERRPPGIPIDPKSGYPESSPSSIHGHRCQKGHLVPLGFLIFGAICHVQILYKAIRRSREAKARIKTV